MEKTKKRTNQEILEGIEEKVNEISRILQPDYKAISAELKRKDENGRFVHLHYGDRKPSTSPDKAPAQSHSQNENQTH